MENHQYDLIIPFSNMVYAIGDEILKSQPFAYIISSSYFTEVCDYCFKFTLEDDSIKLRKCLRCKIAHYCSKSCQEKAWKSHHGFECIYLKNAPTPKFFQEDFLSDTLRMILRVITKLENGGKEEFVMIFGKKRYFDDLMSHKQEFEASSTIMKAFDQLHALIEFWLKDKSPSKDDLLEIYGKLTINQYGIQVARLSGELVIGQGLYLGASVVDHSCSPNAVRVFKGKLNNV